MELFLRMILTNLDKYLLLIPKLEQWNLTVEHALTVKYTVGFPTRRAAQILTIMLSGLHLHWRCIENRKNLNHTFIY